MLYVIGGLAGPDTGYGGTAVYLVLAGGGFGWRW